MVKVPACQPRDHGFEAYFYNDRVSSYDTSTGKIQEADLKVINISKVARTCFAIELK
jgi:hypothetical protein